MPTTFYTKEEVEEIVKEIIHQDSFGDVHYAAQQVSKRERLNFDKQSFVGDLNDD